MELSISQILFFVLPESLLMNYVGLGLINIKIPIKKHIKISLSCICSLVILRNILKLYGIHIIILYFILTLSFKKFIEITWSSAIIASLLGYILLLLGETLVFPLIFQYFNTNIQELINNKLILNWIAFYLTKLPLLITGFMIYFYDFSFFDLESLHKIYNSTGDKQ
ncbi:hypothetical protein [Acetohalobium arabaticum]|uniref:Uncharacterized protein n=1 Tax=Acetohalobium arabaticum (strain ATCC 49924 / DSM 5501 / Z-7288) TaxID=574087 RepID=D9QV70_ACEAZ|nr:hypothetical protein [Acetohalobium arabaticum]ADL12129.1 hypothetical protein Acear_0586 [Acetohalobium arabaticum DSM 5501]